MMVVVAVLALACLLSSACVQSNDAAVARVRGEVESIRRALPTLARDSTELFGLSTEGGELVAYRDSSGTPRLLQAHLLGEMGQGLHEFYYRDGVLISSRL